MNLCRTKRSGGRRVCEPSVHELSWCLQGDRWQSSAVLQQNRVWHPRELCSSGRGSWRKWLCKGLGQGPKEGRISSHMKSRGEGMMVMPWATKASEGSKRWKKLNKVSVRERGEEQAVGQGGWHHIFASFHLEEPVWFRTVIHGDGSTWILEEDSAEAVGVSLSSGRSWLVFSQVEKSG